MMLRVLRASNKRHYVDFCNDDVIIAYSISWVNTLRLRQNGRHFIDGVFKRIFLNRNCCILIKISLNLVPQGPINNIPALVQIMAWRRSSDKPLSELMMAKLKMHIYTSVGSSGLMWLNSTDGTRIQPQFVWVVWLYKSGTIPAGYPRHSEHVDT